MMRKLFSHRYLEKVLIGVYVMYRKISKKLIIPIFNILKKIIFDLQGLMVTLIVLALSLVVFETFRDVGVMLEPILVPQELVDMGYTPEIMTRRLKDNINVYHLDEITGASGTMLDNSYSELDIVLSDVGISIKTVSSYFRDLLGRNITNVSGEMLYHESKQKISLRLRLNSEQILFDDLDNFGEKGIKTLFKKAGEAFTKKLNPFSLAVYYFKNKNKTEALEIVNYIINTIDKDKYDFVRAVNLKGVIHQDDGEYEEAINHYRWAIELDPSFVVPYTNWAGVLVGIGEYNGAIKKIKKANKIDPDNASTYVYWCRTLVSKKQPDSKGAIKKCKKALKLDTDNALAYLYWGVALIRKGEPDWEGAIKMFKETLKLDADNADAHINLGHALMYKRIPDWKEAIKMFQEALKHEQDNAIAYFNWGYALMYKRIPDWEGAIKMFQEALKHEPGNASAYFNQGVALMNKGKPDWEEAIRMFQEALKHEPGNASAYFNQGVALMSKGKPDWEEAIKMFQEALKHEPDNASAYFNWGVALTYKRIPDLYGAIEKYKKVIKLQPMYDSAYEYIIQSLFELQKTDLAIDMQNCMKYIDDSKKRLECSESVLSLLTSTQ